MGISKARQCWTVSDADCLRVTGVELLDCSGFEQQGGSGRDVLYEAFHCKVGVAGEDRVDDRGVFACNVPVLFVVHREGPPAVEFSGRAQLGRDRPQSRVLAAQQQCLMEHRMPFGPLLTEPIGRLRGDQRSVRKPVMGCKDLGFPEYVAIGDRVP